MKLKLDFTPNPGFTMNYREPLLLLGSCFANNIGLKLNDALFSCTVNTNGTVYNPISIAKIIQRGVDGVPYDESDLIQSGEYWYSWHHSHLLTGQNAQGLLKEVNERFEVLQDRLKRDRLTIFISFGSAWVYEYESVGVVANCHKLPAREFSKRLLSTQEIVSYYTDLMEQLPEVRFVFTVSPVRHTRDGLENNNWSKSVLHCAVRELVDRHESAFYFPAYEIVIDELRDYRFFDRDLVHPNDLAIDYVWDVLKETTFDDISREMVKQRSKLKKRFDHRPNNLAGVEFDVFMKETNKLDAEFNQRFFT